MKRVEYILRVGWLLIARLILPIHLSVVSIFRISVVIEIVPISEFSQRVLGTIGMAFSLR
jgi:hypothetical protein